LREAGPDLEDIIPFGWSIFGTVNRWVIRPIFSFLSSFIGSAGIVILVLTFLVKLALYPLTYKMLYSQNKMAALKPRIEKMKEKYKDDAQQVQMETMKLYREFGVNPLGGCLPMVLQMPIWFALYRFFPASIEFRQASFLWATDLSSYDVIARLPFEIPFIGAHLSLFTILWAVTTLIYTYYNTKHMDFGSNPAMKYLQYIMPVMFLGFFNSFAAGLTCYLLFSNLFNITQTVVTKNYIINQDKIHEELEAYKKKPKKKKSGFQERLEAAMKEQQRVQAERQAQKGKSSKKK
jgi:YidC/Oxa1 family membrane protein insertase